MDDEHAEPPEEEGDVDVKPPPVILPDGLWNEVAPEETPERQAIIEGVAQSKPREDRVKALLLLRGKAMNADFREALWADEEIRTLLITCARGPDPDAPQKSLYSDGPEMPDEGVRAVALGAIIHLSAAEANRNDMAADPKVREVVMMGMQVFAADEEQSEFLRQRGFMSLVAVILAGACSPGDEEHDGQKMFDHAMLGFNKELPTRTRAGVLGTLWSLTLSGKADAKAFWKFRPIREAIRKVAAPGENPVVRENALGFLWALTTKEENRVPMWEDEEVRQVLLESVPPTFVPRPSEEESELDELDLLLADSDSEEGEAGGSAVGEDADEQVDRTYQSVEIRTKALRALACLASEVANREPMWNHEPLAVALLDAASETEAAEVRASAIAALLQLGMCYENQLPMYGAGVHSVLALAAEDSTLQKILTKQERQSCGISALRIVEGAEWREWELGEIAAAAAGSVAATDAAAVGEVAAKGTAVGEGGGGVEEGVATHDTSGAS
eukprot:TRINITY_DN73805_c0_g1_i1.p1 TRINITY_DN73805_c0_g1~~TRINITY_DN73805_c0_g1_i1.p1  ORF type:complete len:502 (-),score=120.46 TRINITY_DN73805_c0_g1_i1:144-1649(-)